MKVLKALKLMIYQVLFTQARLQFEITSLYLEIRSPALNEFLQSDHLFHLE